MARKKQTPVPVADVLLFTPDAMVIRSCGADGVSYNDFRWPLDIGAVVTCPDWDPAPRCGNGLHGLLDGLGDWGLIDASPDHIWQIIGVLRSEVVWIDSDKVKFPRGVVLYSGHAGGAVTMIQTEMAKGIQAAVKKATEGIFEAATTGYRSAAATTGYRSAAATKGKNSIAAALGPNSTASAGEGGWIVVTAYDDDWDVVAVRAAKVGGPEGIKAGVRYRLTEAGDFEEVI